MGLELLLVDLAVAVDVGLVDHLLQLLVCHVLAELARHPLQVAEGDLACLVVVEELEDPPDTARAGGDRASKGGAKPMLQGQG